MYVHTHIHTHSERGGQRDTVLHVYCSYVWIWIVSVSSVYLFFSSLPLVVVVFFNSCRLGTSTLAH